MTKPVLDEVGLLAVIAALKDVSPEVEEAAILALEEDHPGIGERVRALLALERQGAEAIRKLEERAAEERVEAARKLEEAEAKVAAEAEVESEPKPEPEPEPGVKFDDEPGSLLS